MELGFDIFRGGFDMIERKCFKCGINVGYYPKHIGLVWNSICDQCKESLT